MRISKGSLKKNWGLKIISFLFAIALWLVVVNINDPTKTLPYNNIQVTVLNDDIITDQNMIYEVLDGTDVISKVNITAPRSVHDNLDRSDITAVVDFNDLTASNTMSIQISVPSRYASQVVSIKSSIDVMKVNIENKKSVQMVLETNIVGEAPDGYIVGGITTDQNLVRVTGPESVVDRIEQAAIKVDMSTLQNFTSDITTSAQVQLLDADGEEVTGSTLKKNPESVMVTIEILSTKDVPVKFQTSGTLAEGYGLNGEIATDPATVKIAGRKSTLSAISELVMPEELIDVTGHSQDIDTQVDISHYLPDGVIFADSTFNGLMKVAVGVEKNTSSEFELEAADISLVNIPEGITCQVQGVAETYTLNVTGIRSVMSTLNARNIVASLDVQSWMTENEMTELAPGTYQVELSFNLPDYTIVTQPIMAQLLVTAEDAEAAD